MHPLIWFYLALSILAAFLAGICFATNAWMLLAINGATILGNCAFIFAMREAE